MQGIGDRPHSSTVSFHAMPLHKKILRPAAMAAAQPVNRVGPATSLPAPTEPVAARPELKAAVSEFDKPSPVDRRDERSNLQLYLNEIRLTPLLTIEDEI